MKRRTFVGSALTAAASLSFPARPVLAAVFRPSRGRLQDLEAVTGDGRTVTLRASALADLRARLRGSLLLRADPGYDDARRVLNPSFDKYPALVVQPTGVADIRTAVDFARENQGLLLAVKCGGHSASGQSSCDRGLQLDLSRFRDVRVDPKARRAWVTGGSLLGQVDHEAMSHGLITPLGTVSHTGVGGLVTGGGFGRIARRFGLSIDNLESVDVVSADGQFHHASATENADLFWGVRGGGGNFGIVTSFEFRLHPMQRQVMNGTILYPFARAKDVLRIMAEYAPEAPDELDFGATVGLPPGGAPGSAGFFACWSGPASGAERALAPFRSLGTPVFNDLKTIDYIAAQRSGDISDPRAMASYLKAGFIRTFPADLIDAIMDGMQGHPGRMTGVFFQLGGGAIARVPSDATAFASRDILANMLCSVGWRPGTDPAEHIQWIRQYWTRLEPFTYGFYVNDSADATAATIQANFRQNHDRLVAVKNRYDPRNLFRLNTNIKPTATG